MLLIFGRILALCWYPVIFYANFIPKNINNQHKSKLANMYIAALKICPSSNIKNVSEPKVENVENPPQNPTIKSKRKLSEKPVLN